MGLKDFVTNTNRNDSLNLKTKQHKESDHKREQPHGFGQRKAEDCIGKKLLLQGRVSCITDY